MPAATLVDLNRLWVDSCLRAVAQRRVELPVLDALAGHSRGGRVLELGCGRRGTGIRQALTRLSATSVDGVELSVDSVLACRAATADLGDRVRVLPGERDA